MRRTGDIKKRILSAVLSVFMLVSFGMTALAVTQADIDKAREDIDNLQSQLDSASDALDALEAQKDKIEANMDSYTSSINSLGQSITKKLAEIEIVEGEIAETENSIEIIKEQIAVTQKLADETQAKADAQYDAMKRRIAFLYENSADSVLVSLAESGSMANMLTKMEYTQSLAAYDREQLNEYEITKEQLDKLVAALKLSNERLEAMVEDLEETKGKLEEAKAELQSEKKKFSNLLSESQSDLNDTKNSITDTNNQIDNLEAQLEKMRQYEAQLEEQKAKEDLARMEQYRQWEAEGWTVSAYEASESEKLLLAALIQCEAGGESYDGKIAVGSVVMNRVDSPRFKQNTITDVIYAAGQFSPVASGRVSLVLSQGPNSTCIQAAEDVLSGTRNVNSLFFRSVASAQKAGFTFESGQIIGNHYFY